MTYIDAIILGIVEGLTEFIPVSSTGHLILVGDLLGANSPQAASFEIVIQLGAILAVVFLYWKRFLDLFNFSKTEKKSFSGINGIALLSIAAFPALAVGALFGHKIKEHLFNPVSVAVALIVGGIALIVFDKVKESATESVDKITYKQALGVGLIQIFALWPGFSRSGSSIIGGLYMGMSRSIAAEFSFLLAVPVLCAACGYELLKNYSQINSDQMNLLLVGLTVSFIVAIFAIKFFITIVQKFSLKPFAYYRIVLGVIVLSLSF